MTIDLDDDDRDALILAIGMSIGLMDRDKYPPGPTRGKLARVAQQLGVTSALLLKDLPLNEDEP